MVAVTSASVQDRPGSRQILARLAAAFPSVGPVWTDGGYANDIDNSLLTWDITRFRLVIQIVKRSDQVKGFQVLLHRWVIERRSGDWSATGAWPANTNA